MAAREIATTNAKGLAAFFGLTLPARAAPRVAPRQQPGPALGAMLAALGARHATLLRLTLEPCAPRVTMPWNVDACVASALRAKSNAALLLRALCSIAKGWQARCLQRTEVCSPTICSTALRLNVAALRAQAGVSCAELWRVILADETMGTIAEVGTPWTLHTADVTVTRAVNDVTE